MKTPRSLRTRGVALVIVLSLVVLLSALIIGFFSSVQNESQSSQTYKGSVSVKQLVSTANGVAMGQIADATHSFKDPSNQQPNATDRLLWASQPGMIRTWDATGKGWKIFKLYSARNMVADFDALNHYSVRNALANEVPNDWPTQTAIFVDLNQPVVVPDDAGGITRVGETQKYRASYPILDPLAMVKSGAINGVDGFAINGVPGYVATGPVVLTDERLDPTVPVPGKTSNPAAMPVRWIYVLQDGTLTVPTGVADGGSTATWDGASAAQTPSRANPIVGRIAFWADDESCKLNVNTASEPTPWDTPRGVTIQDLNYGKYQPSNKEYQRYPGHPFSTALSPVFFPGVVLTPVQKESIYALIPRVPTGGTTSATQSGMAVVPDEDRLFTTVDEFLFRPPPLLGAARPENTVMDSKRLRRSRFFLTANSRSPELNAYGQPRISMWPVWGNSNHKTAFDSLASFCSSTGSISSATVKPYYFQRTDCNSPHTDYDNIPRNQQLYKYLQRLTSTPVPGYGGTFQAKWADDRDQVLTEIFDYIRCVNIHDSQSSSGAVPYTPAGKDTVGAGQVAPILIGSTKGFGRFHSIEQVGFHFICSQQEDKGILSPAGSTFKLGPNERMVEAAFLIEPFSPSLGWFWLKENMFFDVSFVGSFTLDGQDLKMRSGGKALVNNIGNGWHNNGRERGGTGGIRGPVAGLGGGSYQYVSTANPRVTVGKGGKSTMTFSGGQIQIKVYVGGSASATNLVQTFVVNFPGGELPLPDLVVTPNLASIPSTEGYRGTVSTFANEWWTISTRYGNATQTPHAPGIEYANPARRFSDEPEGKAGFKKGGLFRREDVVRTIVPDNGDMRLIAAKTNVGPEFVPVVDSGLWNSAYRFEHIFSNASGTHFLFGFCNEPGTANVTTNPNDIPPGGLNSQLVPSPDIVYHYARMPQVRPGAGKKFNAWNDFDNGSAQWPDGAYINKPDEGNQSTTNGVGGAAYTYFAWDFAESTETYFSPNRLVPSPGMLGSLPTGVKRNRPWETLLFRPELRRNAQGELHPGADPAKGPKDHLILDLFWMPFCEPYAISEPFSTAGKVNLNYEIAPFSYITRSTALYGAFKAEEPLLIPNAATKIIKLWDHESNDNGIMPDDARDNDAQVRSDWAKIARGQAPFDKLRRPIDMVETLQQADKRFSDGEVFRSASELCEMHLVRQGEKLADYQKTAPLFMDGYLMTGDNTRERPYTNIYAKLTTRSNTYTVHSRVQVIRSGGANDNDWKVYKEDASHIISESRGASIVERYIDPADPNLPDFAISTAANLCADEAYRFRVVATKRFMPEPSKQ